MERPDETALLNHHYQLAELIERGPLSEIRRAIHRTTQKQCAIKTIDLRKYEASTGLARTEVEHEMELCARLKHPFICELRDVIAGESIVHMVFEYTEGADIAFEIVSRTAGGFVYSEAVASHYMKQLLLALEYLHKEAVIHRDVRPHNLVLSSKDNSSPLKLCGFGAAIQLAAGEDSVEGGRVGVPQFMAPEVVARKRYGTPVDMWGAGCLLHLLLVGRLPFNGPLDIIYADIQSARYSLSTTDFCSISAEARDLLGKMLQVDPLERCTATEALAHPWIASRDTCAPRRHLQTTVEQIKKYNQRRKLKSSILSALNTPRWLADSQHSDLNGDAGGIRPSSSFFLSGDISGGDTCHPDGCTRSEQTAGEDTRGAQMVLASLDQMASIGDAGPPDDRTFAKLLQLYDRISNLSAAPAVTDSDGTNLSKHVTNYIDTLLAPSAEAVELRQLLNNHHLASSLQAHDVIVHEVLEGEAGREQRPESSQEGSSGVVQGQTPPPPFSYLNGGVLPLGAGIAGTSHDDDGFGAYQDDDDDLLMNNVARIRLVQFVKDGDEPMGITLKVTEDGRCFVARIMHGGMIHRQATLHVGDEIREINGVSVANRSVDALQQILRDARGQVTFKIVPSYRSAPPACEIFVRAQFDYQPGQDDLIPCPQAGLAFNTGDILQVISKDDHNWWQARFVASFPALGSPAPTGPPTAGLIPSPELQEWRTACLAMERAKDQSAHCMWFSRKKKYYTTKYLQKHSALFDQLDLVTYEEVMRLSQYRRKTLVLLGAHGVGRRHIKNTLIHRHPGRFAYPIPHTTRPPRKDEIDGKHYHFVSSEQMRADIEKNEYLEYGSHEDSMYGTKLDTIRNIHKAGKIAILDVEPQALKVLRTAEYSPFVVFIAAPNLQGLHDPDGSLERLVRESEVLRQAFGHLFDLSILNNDIDETIAQLERLAEKLHTCPQWLPVSWVY